jgi:hypothetical protein
MSVSNFIERSRRRARTQRDERIRTAEHIDRIQTRTKRCQPPCRRLRIDVEIVGQEVGVGDDDDLRGRR